MLYTFFLVCSIAFVFVRVLWHQPESKESTEYQSTREKLLASQFSILLFGSHGYWITNASTCMVYWSDGIRYVGAVFMFVSIPWLYWVHHSLGRFFSARLELRKDHTIIQTGPYKWIRHPMYTSGFLYVIGAGLLSGNIGVLLLPLVGFSLLVFVRVPDEEKMLAQLPDYEEYKNKTGRFFPKL